MKHKALCLLPLFLLLALILAPSTGATEEDVYAILYADKTLVFQYGDAPENGREVTKAYPVNLNGSVSWRDKASTIRAVVFKDTIQPLSMADWFRGFSSLKSIQGLDKVDTSKVTDMSGLFAGCSKFTEMNLLGLDTSSVTSMSYMFQDCSHLKSLNADDWNTSNVTDMTHMFCDCSSLAALDVSGWDTSNVTNMWSMFYNCSSLTTLDVSGFDTSSVTDMGEMFYGCGSLTALDVSGFDTSNVTHMGDMFFQCFRSAASTLPTL